MEAMNSENSDDTVQQTDDAVQQSGDTVEHSKSTVPQLDSAVEQADDAVEHMDTTEPNPETNDMIHDTTSHTEDIGKSAPIKVDCDEQESKNDSIDFTADISIDQLDTHKEVTDEDVMHHLDVIENIELDPETFGMNKSEKNINQSITIKKEGETQHEEEVTAVDEVRGGIKENWYKKKIAEKETLVKERLSKLARVLGITYPHYEKWLERIEKKEGSPMCKLEPTRRCSLDKPHTNRWKFECIMKNTQVTVNEKDNPESFNKPVWHLEPTSAWGVDINNTSEFPAFVLKAVKLRLYRIVVCAVNGYVYIKNTIVGVQYESGHAGVLTRKFLQCNTSPFSTTIQQNASDQQDATREESSSLSINTGTPDKLYKKIEVEVRGNDPAVLKSYGIFAVTAANHLKINVARNTAPYKPIHERWTVLKSAHVHKKHRVQYEFRTYYRYLDFLKLTGSTADTFLEYLQRNLPEGVAMKVTKTELEQLPESIAAVSQT